MKIWQLLVLVLFILIAGCAPMPQQLQQAEVERRQAYVAAHPTLDEITKNRILQGKIAIGMTSEEIAEEKEAKYAALMRAKGLIKFEGKWMTPDQKMAIQKERQRQREERERYVAEQRAKGLIKYKGKSITKEEKEKQILDKAISYIETTKYIYRGASETYLRISIIYSFSYENPEFIGWEITPDPDNPAATLVTMKFSTTGVSYLILTASSSQVNNSIKEKMKKAVPLLRITWRINDLTGLTITPYNFYAEDALTIYKDVINGLLKIAK